MSSTPWIIGTLAAVAYFSYFEWRAFQSNRYKTLSRSIYDLGHHWPLSIFIMGMFAGGLAVHFFWQYCPDGGTGVGFLPFHQLALGN